MASLSQGEITLGRYARDVNALTAQLAAGQSSIERAYEEQRRREGEARARALENLSNRISEAFDSTTCYTTGSGNTSTTRCY